MLTALLLLATPAQAACDAADYPDIEARLDCFGSRAGEASGSV